MDDAWQSIDGYKGKLTSLVLMTDDEADPGSLRLCITYKQSEDNEKRSKEFADQIQKVLTFYANYSEGIEKARASCPDACRDVFNKLCNSAVKTFGEGHELSGPSVALCAAVVIQGKIDELAVLKQRNETLEFLVAQSP